MRDSSKYKQKQVYDLQYQNQRKIKTYFFMTAKKASPTGPLAFKAGSWSSQNLLENSVTYRKTTVVLERLTEAAGGLEVSVEVGVHQGLHRGVCLAAGLHLQLGQG